MHSLFLLSLICLVVGSGFTMTCKQIEIDKNSILNATCLDCSRQPKPSTLNLDQYIGVQADIAEPCLVVCFYFSAKLTNSINCYCYKVLVVYKVKTPCSLLEIDPNSIAVATTLMSAKRVVLVFGILRI